MALSDDQKLRVRPDVMSRQLEDETVLLDLASGTYFGLNDAGAEIWSLLRAEATVAEMRARLLETFEVAPETVTRDLEALLTTLQQRGLIEPVT